MIANFPKKKSYNPGGLRTFKFVPVSFILSYPAIIDGKINSALQLLPGKEWLTGYSTPYTLEYSENAKKSTQGDYYDQSLSGFAPGDHEDLLDVIQSLNDQYFILLVEDARGQLRLVGGYGFPLAFTADFSSGSSRSDSKGFSFEFSGQSIFRAPIYKI